MLSMAPDEIAHPASAIHPALGKPLLHVSEPRVAALRQGGNPSLDPWSRRNTVPGLTALAGDMPEYQPPADLEPSIHDVATELHARASLGRSEALRVPPPQAGQRDSVAPLDLDHRHTRDDSAAGPIAPPKRVLVDENAPIQRTPAFARAGRPWRIGVVDVLGALVIVAVIVLWYRIGGDDGAQPTTSQPLAAGEGQASSGFGDIDLERRPDDAPECWIGDVGFFFVYTNDRGIDVVAERIVDVPLHLRRRARCVVEER
jgi:hypothetical protein